MRSKWPVVCLTLACVCLMPSSASADADGDFRAVVTDYRDHNGDVTACKFTRVQLVHARDRADADPFVANYVPEFGVEVRREIQRYDSGGCLSVSPQRGLAISRIRPRKRESITIRNTGALTARLKGVTLRDRSGNRLKLGNGTLKAGRLLRVFTGCARKRRKAVRRGSRLYACRTGTVWNDKGDVVKLVNSLGSVVAQRGYGTRKNAPLV